MCTGTLIASVWLLSMPISVEGHVTAAELIDHFQQTADKLQSYALKLDMTEVTDVSVNPGTRTQHHTYDLRYDGNRLSCRSYTWNGSGSQSQPLLQDRGHYHSLLRANKRFITYARLPRELGKVTIDMQNFKALGTGRAEYLTGEMAGHLEAGRLDKLLRGAKSITVRDKMSQINGSDCYVIDAVAVGGRYTVWIDPQHDYHLAQYEVRREQGDIDINGSLVKPGVSVYADMKNVRFAQIDGQWMPMECDTVYEAKGQQGFYAKARRHIKRTELILNPDHDALRSFVPDDILEGAEVRVVNGQGVPYVWRNGGIEAYVDDKTLTSIADQIQSMDSKAAKGVATRSAASSPSSQSVRPSSPPDVYSPGFPR